MFFLCWTTISFKICLLTCYVLQSLSVDTLCPSKFSYWPSDQACPSESSCWPTMSLGVFLLTYYVPQSLPIDLLCPSESSYWPTMSLRVFLLIQDVIQALHIVVIHRVENLYLQLYGPSTSLKLNFLGTSFKLFLLSTSRSLTRHIGSSRSLNYFCGLPTSFKVSPNS